MKKKNWLLTLVMPLLLLLGLAMPTETVQVAELQNVVTGLGIWDVGNGRLAT